MSWEVMQKYRARAVGGEFAIKVIPTTGTRYVEGLVEPTIGPQTGQRVRYRGYLNSPKNVETTTAELRAMGWRGAKWGDWSGIGAREFQFTLLADEATDGSGSVFYRAGFVRDVPRIDRTKNAVKAADLDELNAKLPPPPPPTANGAPASSPSSSEEAAPADDAIPF